jgi:hypothetical protein
VRLEVTGLIGPINAAGSVQCLSTSRSTGNGFAELDEPLPDGSRFLLFDVLDPVDPADPKRPDMFFWNFSATRPERQFGLCLTTGRGIAGRTTGNLVVHDAPPLGPQS